MVEAATEFRKNGFNDSDAATLAKTATMFQNVSDEAISAGDSASFIISQMIAFGIEAENAQSIIDKVNEVANRFSVSSGDLSKALGIVASTSAAMGNTIDETLGVVTAITEQTRNASKSARAANTIFSRLAQVVDENSDVGKKLTEIYNNLDIALYDSSGQMRSTYDILADLASQWGSLDKNTQQYIAITSAGTNQLNNFLALMNNFDHAAEATATSIDSAGSAMRENEAYQESLEYQTNNLKATFQDLANNVIDKELISSVLKLGDSFLKLANTDIGVLVTKIGLLAGTGWGLSSLIQVSKIIPIIVGQFKNFGAVLSLVTEGSGTFGAALSAAGGAASVALPTLLAVSAAIVAIVEVIKAYKASHPDFDTATQTVGTLSESIKTAQDRLKEINQLDWKDRTRAINAEEEELKALIEQQERELKVAEMRQAMAAGEELSERTGYGKATRYTVISPHDVDNQTFTSMDEAVKSLAETEGITGQSTDELKQKLLDLGYAFVTTTENTKLTADEMNALDTQALRDLINSIKENGELNTNLSDSYQGLYEQLAPTYLKIIDVKNAYDHMIPGARELTDSERELKSAFEELVGTMVSFDEAAENDYQKIATLANLLKITPVQARDLAVSMGLVDSNTRLFAGALTQLEDGSYAAVSGINEVKNAIDGVDESVSTAQSGIGALTQSLFGANGQLTEAAKQSLATNSHVASMAQSFIQAQQAQSQANFENLIDQIYAVGQAASITTAQISSIMSAAGVGIGLSDTDLSKNLQRTYQEKYRKSVASDPAAYKKWLQDYVYKAGQDKFLREQKKYQEQLKQLSTYVPSGGGGGGSSSTKQDQEEVKSQTINTIEELREYLTDEETRLKLIDPDISKSDLQSTLSEVATIYQSYQDYLSQLKQQGFDETSDQYKQAEAEFAQFIEVLKTLFSEIVSEGTYSVDELVTYIEKNCGDLSGSISSLLDGLKDKISSTVSSVTGSIHQAFASGDANSAIAAIEDAWAMIRQMGASIEETYDAAVAKAVENAAAEKGIAEEVAEEYDRQNQLLEDKIALEEKLEALERAKQRRMLVYSEGRFQYMQDADAISGAQADYQETYRGIEQSQKKDLLGMLGDKSSEIFEKYFSESKTYQDVMSYPEYLRDQLMSYLGKNIAGTIYEGMSADELYSAFGSAMQPGEAYKMVKQAAIEAEEAREQRRQREAELKKQIREENVKSYGVDTDFGKKILESQSQEEAAYWAKLRDTKIDMMKEYRDVYGDEATKKYFGVSDLDSIKSTKDVYKEAWSTGNLSYSASDWERQHMFDNDEQYRYTVENPNLTAAQYNVAAGLSFDGYKKADQALFTRIFSGSITKSELQDIYNDKSLSDVTKGYVLNLASEMKNAGYSGYARGTRGASGGLSIVGENGPELRVLNHGDGILPNNITDNLWRWGSMTPTDMLSSLAQKAQSLAQTLNINNVTLPNVRDAQSFVSGLRELAQQYVTRRS